jgi:hypothetical protein
MKKRLLSNYHFYVLLFWLLLFITLWLQCYLASGFRDSLVFAFCFILACFIVVMFTSTFLLPKAIKSKKFTLFVLQAFFISCILAGLLSYIIFLLYPETLHFKISPFLYYLTSTLPTSLMLMLGFCGLEFFRQHLIQEKIHSGEKLAFLQQQMNPHLIFNVLNHLHVLMRTDQRLALQLLEQFSGALRYQLYECNQERVRLEKEIKYLQEIVAIGSLRWHNLIDVDFTCEIGDGTKLISPFILITFIENAFKHVSRLPEKKGWIKVSLTEFSGDLSLQIQNSKGVSGIKTPDEYSGLGLENTRKRLALLYPSKHKLIITDEGSTFDVKLSIKLE